MDALVIGAIILYIIIGLGFSSEHGELAVIWPILAVFELIFWLIDRRHDQDEYW